MGASFFATSLVHPHARVYEGRDEHVQRLPIHALPTLIAEHHPLPKHLFSLYGNGDRGHDQSGAWLLSVVTLEPPVSASTGINGSMDVRAWRL